VSAYSTGILADAPVGFWKLSETSGTTATDSAGSLNGTYQGSPTLGGSGLVYGETGAMKATGANQYCSLPLTSSYNEFSVEVTFIMDSKPASGTIGGIVSHAQFFAASTANFPFMIRVDDAGVLQVMFSKGDDFAVDLTLSTPLVVATKYHVIVTRNASGYCALYVNGVLVASGTMATAPSTYSGAWNIGRLNEQGGGVNGSTFRGSIACVSIYNYALSAAQAKAHYLLAIHYSVSGNITESLAITDWRVTATRCRDGAYMGSEVATGSTYSVGAPTNEPCNITLSLKIDDIWEANKVMAVDKYVVASNPDATPHLFKVTAVTGDAKFGATEPTYNLSGTTTSGNVTLTYIAPLVDPITLGPKIPS